MKLRTALLTATALLASIAYADVVVTKNGSTVTGKILGIDGGKITIETEFAGKIEILQSQVASFSTDDPIYLSLESGTTYLGTVDGSAAGLQVKTSEGNLNANLTTIEESWQPGKKSPTQIRHDEALAKMKEHWGYEAAFDLTGKSGNKESTGLAASFRATRKGQNDTLAFYARTNFEETDGSKSADDARAGLDYTNKIRDGYNWYIRSEFGRDAIKDIDLFVTTAAGFGYGFYDTDTRKLNLRAGLGYVYETYGDLGREDTSAASLDLGLFHQETFKWGKLTNRLTYTPTLEDFGNYRLFQDSNLDLPLKAEGWSTRIGVSNTYDSEAALSAKEELDTTYYIRLVLNWQ